MNQPKPVTVEELEKFEEQRNGDVVIIRCAR